MENLLFTRSKVFFGALTTLLFYFYSFTASCQTSGLFYTAEEVAIWKDRVLNGPYKTLGDMTQNSPGEWNRMVSFANDFRANPDADDWNGTKPPEPHGKHLKLSAAAFVSLITADNDLANKVKAQLLDHANRITTAQLDVYVNQQEGFHTANWFTRLLIAYDLVKNHFSAGEKQTMENWFRTFAYYFANNVNNTMSKFFPYRLNGDYVTRQDAAATGEYSPGDITYVNPDGSIGHQIYWIHKQYNNRYFSKIKFPALAGVFLSDTTLVFYGKTFVKEFLRYGVFPDGSMGEYERNGDYGKSSTGALYYGGVNVESCINIADALARKGDFELYEYTTSEGIFGTEGGSKNIRLLIQTYCDILSGRKEWYYNSVADTNRLALVIPGVKESYVGFDVMFGMANHYYKDNYFNQVYTRRYPGMTVYPGTGYWHVVAVWWPWSGVTATFPSFPFMYGDMEGKVSPYPNLTTPDIVEDSSGLLTKSGNWTTTSSVNSHGGTHSWSNVAGNYVECTFQGSSVKLYCKTGASAGIANIYIDNMQTPAGTWDSYQSTASYQVLAFEAYNLGAGSHKIRIAVSGNKNANSGGIAVNLDYLEFSSSVSDTEAPGSPTGLIVTDSTTSSASLKWNAATDNVGVAGYKIFRNNVEIATTDQITFTDSGLTANTTYSYKVKAYDAAGNESPASTSVNASTLAYLHYIVEDTNSQLIKSGNWTTTSSTSSHGGTHTWSGVAGSYLEFAFEGTSIKLYGKTGGGAGIANIYIDNMQTPVATWDGYQSTATYQVLAYENYDLSAGSHTFRIAVSGNKNSSSGGIAANMDYLEINADPGDIQAPSVPAGLAVADSTTSAITLSWNASTDNVGVAGYKIFRNGSELDTTSATTYTDSGLTAGTSYSYTVKAYDAASNVSAASTAVNGTTKTDGVPYPWQNHDIGSVAAAGSAIYNNGAFTVKGSGADIWGTADEFHFVYQEITGDFEMVARITEIQNTDGNAKAGVMVREMLTAGSKHVLSNVTPASKCQLIYRAAANGVSSYALGSTPAAYHWVKVSRTGNLFIASESVDGINWNQMGSSVTISMTSSVYVGLAVLSRNDGVLNTSVFDNVSIATFSSARKSTGSDRVADARKLSEEREEISFYPNPVGKNLTLNNVPPGSSISVYNLTGIKVQEAQCGSTGDAVLKMETLSPGVYRVEVCNSKETIKSFKLIKQ